MTCNKDILSDFLSECCAGMKGLKSTSSLVVMNKNCSCSVIEACLSRVEDITKMIIGQGGALGWKSFDDHASAEKFVDTMTHPEAERHMNSRSVSISLYLNFVQNIDIHIDAFYNPI